MKPITQLAISFITLSFSIQIYAWEFTEVMECKDIGSAAKPIYNCKNAEVPAKLPYQMEDGTTRVVGSRLSARCYQGSCVYGTEFAPFNSGGVSNEYAGAISAQNVIWVQLHRGYYVGEAADGRIVAYMTGSGPMAGQPPAGALQAEEPTSEVDQCVDAWADETRKEIGEFAMITGPQIEEWTEWCKEGNRP